MNGVLVVGMGAVDPDLVDEAAAAAALWGPPIERIPPLPEPEGARDAGRGQWAAAPFLKNLNAALPAGALRILGVTERDLFVPVLSFVFGQAQMEGPAAVVSLARLRPEFYGLPPDPPLLRARARKEAVHEVGHTFGLVHCPHESCPMSLSVGVWQVDRKGEAPCRSCAALARGRAERARRR